MSSELNIIGLVLMIGLPGSGKSTLTKSVSQYIKMKLPDARVHQIVYDELIPISIQSGNDLVSWRNARASVMESVRKLVIQEKEKNLDNRSSHTIIILDDNMYYRSMRYSFYQLARSCGIGFCQIYLIISIEEALHRNCTRLSPVLPDVILRMSTRLQPPDEVHNPWEKYSIGVSSTQPINVEEIYKFIKSSLEHIPHPILALEVTANVPSSIIHKADIEMRRIIGATIRDEMVDKQAKASELNELRRQLLEKIRIGDVSVPSDKNITRFLSEQLTSEEPLHLM